MKFAGYAALWDRVDRSGDVFRRGAFAEGAVPLLWQHRGAPVGRVTAVADTHGLRVTGKINDVKTAELVCQGGLDGLSVGYRTHISRQGVWREIVAADLIEVSLVAQPMQPGARIVSIEADAEVNSASSDLAGARPAGLAHDAD